MTRSATQSRRFAFTLVEVLAAMVLIGIALPVTMRVVTVTTRTAAHARHLTEAGQLAELKLGELRLLTGTSSYNGSGEFADQPEYRWESFSATTDNGCYEVTVRVTWQGQNTPREFQLTTLIYPTATPTTEEP